MGCKEISPFFEKCFKRKKLLRGKNFGLSKIFDVFLLDVFGISWRTTYKKKGLAQRGRNPKRCKVFENSFDFFFTLEKQEIFLDQNLKKKVFFLEKISYILFSSDKCLGLFLVNDMQIPTPLHHHGPKIFLRKFQMILNKKIFLKKNLTNFFFHRIAYLKHMQKKYNQNRSKKPIYVRGVSSPGLAYFWIESP